MSRRVVVLGATGVLGRSLVPRLLKEGCTVVGTGVSGSGFQHLSDQGARMRQLDVMDTGAVEEVLLGSGELYAVVNLVSHLPQYLSGAALKELEVNNTLNLLSTKPLMKIIQKANPTRYVATSHSYCTRPYVRYADSSYGGHVQPGSVAHIGLSDEYSDKAAWEGISCSDSTNPLSLPTEYPHVDSICPVLQLFNQGVHRREYMTVSYRTGIPMVLRLGHLYGAGTTFGKGGAMYEQAKSGAMRFVGPGIGKWSFLHVEDASAALRNAVLNEHVRQGVFNVVDGRDPTTEEWMYRYCAMLNSPRPPAPLGFFATKYAARATPHYNVWSNLQRPGNPDPFNSIFSWAPEKPAMWEVEE